MAHGQDFCKKNKSCTQDFFVKRLRRRQKKEMKKNEKK